MTEFQHRDMPAPDQPAHAEAPIVPKTSIAGTALVAVVAIMTFLAALTTGAVVLVMKSASEWQSEVAREMTIQVRPVPNRNVDTEVAKAVAVARAANGVAEVRPYTQQEISAPA